MGASSRHNSLSDYNKGKVPTNELQIYTWKDATLKELTSLVREVNPDSGRKGVDDSKTLAQSGFVIGDYLDISITPPGSAARGMMSLDRMANDRDRDHRGMGGG